MADGRKNNGGHSTKAKRPNDKRLSTKSEQLKLIEKLSPIEPEAHEALAQGVKDGNFNYVKLFFEYMYGKATDKKEISLTDDTIKQFVIKGAKGNTDK